MSDGDAPARKNDDGSIDIWVDGWRGHFPRGGKEPKAEREPEPDPPPGSLSGVSVEAVGPATGVRYGGWILLLGEKGYDVVRVKPKLGDTHTSFFRYRLGAPNRDDDAG